MNETNASFVTVQKCAVNFETYRFLKKRRIQLSFSATRLVLCTGAVVCCGVGSDGALPAPRRRSCTQADCQFVVALPLFSSVRPRDSSYQVLGARVQVKLHKDKGE